MLKAARSAYLAGFEATSNVLASQIYGIPVAGTMAHSYIQAFPDELTAFRAYAEAYPDACVLLLDTYDTLHGAKNAAVIGQALSAAGHRLRGVRLDSGDLAELSVLDMAYKMVAYSGRPVLKLSTGKATWPGPKQVWRRRTPDGSFEDQIGVADERGPEDAEALLVEVMREGRQLHSVSVEDVRARLYQTPGMSRFRSRSNSVYADPSSRSKNRSS